MAKSHNVTLSLLTDRYEFTCLRRAIHYSSQDTTVGTCMYLLFNYDFPSNTLLDLFLDLLETFSTSVWLIGHDLLFVRELTTASITQVSIF